MQHDAQVTIAGYVGTDVELKESSNGNDRATFRLATTPRFLDRHEGAWRDHETLWMNVKAWRTLARNVASSVRCGEPVVVVGRLRAERWTGEDGQERRRDVVDAILVAHDLSRGTTSFRRNERPPERSEPVGHAQESRSDERSDNSVPAAV